MKITGIDIGEYRQFRNISFDFTYPNNHPKAGQPLEKVCFIGQSGTGKTTLLNVIWSLSLGIEKAIKGGRGVKNEEQLGEEHRLDDTLESTIYKLDINGYQVYFDRFKEIGKSQNDFLKYWLQEQSSLTKKFELKDTNKFSIYIKDSIAREADAFLADQQEQPQTFSDFVKTTSQIDEDKSASQQRIMESGRRGTISLGDMKSLSIWQYLLKDIINYDRETPKFMVNLGTKAREKTQIAFKELEAWLAKNPRIEFQENCLKPLLDKLFLEVDLVGEDGAYLALRTKGGIKIPNDTLSTGTRQILATAIPIYKFDTKGTVILFDEPERSLFPDIQRELVKYYTGLAPEAQFFFATHSPIIAAAFEPCERFILYFDENGEVKCRNGVAPIGDDPNDVLRKDFDMSPLVPQEGVEAYQNYLDLATKIKNEPDLERRMELIAERSILGNKYDFPVTKVDEKN